MGETLSKALEDPSNRRTFVGRLVAGAASLTTILGLPRAANADSMPDTNGTVVQEVDVQGNCVQSGFLNGKKYYTVSWSVRPADPGDTTACPIWIKNVVLSETPNGARKGAALAGKNDADLSSSSTSKNVTAILVDAHGKRTASHTYRYSLVRRIQGDPPPGQMAIASELWFSEDPIDQIIANTRDPTLKQELTTMANRGKGANGGIP